MVRMLSGSVLVCGMVAEGTPVYLDLEKKTSKNVTNFKKEKTSEKGYNYCYN